MFYGELELDGSFIGVNAGHPPPFHLAADGTVTHLDRGGPVLGPLPAATDEPDAGAEPDAAPRPAPELAERPVISPEDAETLDASAALLEMLLATTDDPSLIADMRVERWQATLASLTERFQIIVFNDGSTDRTAADAKHRLRQRLLAVRRALALRSRSNFSACRQTPGSSWMAQRWGTPTPRSS